MRFLDYGFIMLYTEDFTMRHYVGFSQIGSQLTKDFNQLRWRPIILHVSILTVSSLHC